MPSGVMTMIDPPAILASGSHMHFRSIQSQCVYLALPIPVPLSTFRQSRGGRVPTLHIGSSSLCGVRNCALTGVLCLARACAHRGPCEHGSTPPTLSKGIPVRQVVLPEKDPPPLFPKKINLALDHTAAKGTSSSVCSLSASPATKERARMLIQHPQLSRHSCSGHRSHLGPGPPVAGHNSAAPSLRTLGSVGGSSEAHARVYVMDSHPASTSDQANAGGG